MAKLVEFVVERTVYGWSVGAGSEKLGLFVTQQQALADVKKRRALLASKGGRSTLLVTGQETAQELGRRLYPFRG
jgi:hypothetical protein